VGDTTARRARERGFTTVVSAGGDAVALADLVRRSIRPGQGTLLLATGQDQGQALAGTLRRDGYRVLRRVVYAARPVAALPEAAAIALQAGRIRAALFFSAETARQFVRMVQAAGLTQSVQSAEAVAIGQAAAVALRPLPWYRLRVAARPNQNEMLALL
jgi:uroporphyrinogen-III synthase